MLQLLPRLLRLGRAADPPRRSRHQKRQGVLLQHVWPRLHLCKYLVVDTGADGFTIHCIDNRFWTPDPSVSCGFFLKHII